MPGNTSSLPPVSGHALPALLSDCGRTSPTAPECLVPSRPPDTLLQAEQGPPSPVPMDVIHLVLSHLRPNDLACSGRQLCRETAQRFSLPRHRTANTSQPLPPHVASWAEEDTAPALSQGLHALSFRRKLCALSSAAATGSEANLAVTWRVVRPCLLPGESPQHYADKYQARAEQDPAMAAVRQGHVHLLPYMVQHGCPLDVPRTLAAVAQHCDLSALREAWALLPQLGSSNGGGSDAHGGGNSSSVSGSGGDVATDEQGRLSAGGVPLPCTDPVGAASTAPSGPSPPLSPASLPPSPLPVLLLPSPSAGTSPLGQPPPTPSHGPLSASTSPASSSIHEQRDLIFAGAARSRTPDALAKMQWLLSAGSNTANTGANTSTSTSAADWRDVKWGPLVASAAAESGDLERLQWLHAEGCCPALAEPGTLVAALRNAGLLVLDWLVDVAGCPVPVPRPGGAGGAGGAGAGALQQGEGHVEEEGPGLHQAWELSWQAAARGGLDKVRWLLSRGSPMYGGALGAAIAAGQLPTISVLLDEHGMAPTARSFRIAARSGSVAVAALLLSRGCPMHPDAYVSACARGELAMLRWLAQEARCPHAHDTVSKVIHWWPRGSVTVTAAAAAKPTADPLAAGHAAVTALGTVGGQEATAANGGCGRAESVRVSCSGSGGSSMVVLVAAGSCLQAVQLLVEAGCPVGLAGGGAPEVNAACELGELALVVWLVEQAGCTFDHRTLVSAVSGGCTAVVEYVLRGGCPSGPQEAFRSYSEALRNGDVAMLRCLVRLGVPWVGWVGGMRASGGWRHVGRQLVEQVWGGEEALGVGAEVVGEDGVQGRV